MVDHVSHPKLPCSLVPHDSPRQLPGTSSRKIVLYFPLDPCAQILLVDGSESVIFFSTSLVASYGCTLAYTSLSWTWKYGFEVLQETHSFSWRSDGLANNNIMRYAIFQSTRVSGKFNLHGQIMMVKFCDLAVYSQNCKNFFLAKITSYTVTPSGTEFYPRFVKATNPFW